MMLTKFCGFSQGQTESKKLSKQQRAAAGIETKGTAMSFGFKKKLLSSNKRNNDNANHGAKEKETETENAAYLNANHITGQMDDGRDDNGNTGRII